MPDYCQPNGSIPLQRVDIEGTLDDFMADVTVVQTYENVEDVPIEAVYTFPVPTDAVLLELGVTLGEQLFQGTIIPKGKAQSDYENAMVDGKMAVLLEEISPGLFSASVGNIRPGQKPVLRFRYGQFHVWNGERMRFRLPMTIADRYGDPQAPGFMPHQIPESALNAEYPFTLKLSLKGDFICSALESPTHPLHTHDEGDMRILTMTGVADRDIVLNFERPEHTQVRARMEWDKDGVMAMIRYQPPRTEKLAPCHLGLVLDCSGSMSGSSIAQAKEAMMDILDQLGPDDTFTITCFGSQVRSLTGDTPWTGTQQHIDAARRCVRGIAANMGGTELGLALESVYASAHGKSEQDILLITDGEVMAGKKMFTRAKASGCRFFTIGVGAAVAEDIVQGQAEATGGACELVTPNEDMAERILCMFRRMKAHPAPLEVSWPMTPEWGGQRKFPSAFSGDSIFLFARYTKVPESMVHVRQNGSETVIPLPQPTGNRVETSVLARMAASKVVRQAKTEMAGLPLALRYQLLSQWTGCLFVDERADAAVPGELPALRTVPQMMAAGQAGVGAFAGSVLGLECFSILGDASALADAEPQQEASEATERKNQEEAWDEAEMASLMAGLESFMTALAANADKPYKDRRPVVTIADLELLGLPARCVEILRRLGGKTEPESAVVIVFLALLAEYYSSREDFTRIGKLLQRREKKLPKPLGEKIGASLEQAFFTRLLLEAQETYL